MSENFNNFTDKKQEYRRFSLYIHFNFSTEIDTNWPMVGKQISKRWINWPKNNRHIPKTQRYRTNKQKKTEYNGYWFWLLLGNSFPRPTRNYKMNSKWQWKTVFHTRTLVCTLFLSICQTSPYILDCMYTKLDASPVSLSEAHFSFNLPICMQTWRDATQRKTKN